MKRFLMGTTFSVLAVMAAGSASAQSAKSDTTIDELVVTAQRREQAAQDVGIALSVLGSADLASRGISNVNQLQNATPNLQIEPAFGGGAPQFRMRGVGFNDYASNNTPTVGVYVNEVAFPVPVMTQGLLFDIQRVEVLRGPQGTLYGRNTTGGAISFVTGKPTASVTGGASVEFGRFEALKAEGFISGPITEGIRARLALATEQDGGFQHNRDTGAPLGDADRTGGRLLVDFDITPDAMLTLDLHGGIDKSENVGVYLLNPLASRNGLGPVYSDEGNRFHTGWLIAPTLARDTGLPRSAKPGRDNYTYGSSMNLGWNFGGVKLTNIAAYDYLRREEYGDWDSSPSIEADTFFGSKVKVWSDELRLASNSDGPFQWVGGVYVSKQRQRERFYSDFNDIYGTYGRVLFAQLVKSAAVFGQAEYAFTDQWKVIGGLRYEKETRDLEGFGSAFGGATALPPTNVSTKMTPLTGKLAIEYKPVEHVLLYLSASKGVKSGGFTTYNTGNASAIQPFGPEKLYAYELGFKSDPLPNLQINGAAYLYDYRDQQIQTAVYAANGPIGRIANVPKSEIRGAELEITWKPIPSLSITQNASYKRGHYKEFFDLDTPASRAAGKAVYTDRAGQHLPLDKWSYSGAVDYTADIGDYAVVTDVNYSFRSVHPSYFGAKYDIPSYWLVNANVTIHPHDGPWGAGIYVRNVLGEKYDLTRNFFTNADIAQPGAPRTYGVRLTYDY